MKVLVCGGRDYLDRRRVFAVLDFNRSKIDCIVHGGARGADESAGLWAHENDVPCKVYYADWRRDGLAADPRRNELMLRKEHPDLVVAFPGGRGTAHMVRIAREAGVRVIEIPG